MYMLFPAICPISCSLVGLRRSCSDVAQELPAFGRDSDYLGQRSEATINEQSARVVDYFARHQVGVIRRRIPFVD